MLKEKGIKKGGTMFPKYSLKDVLPNLRELLNKTHTKSINIEQLNAGVFKVGAKSAAGKVRYSSLKQFTLIEGTYNSITASDLAKRIELGAEDEKIQFIREAFFNVRTFRNTFETYQGSTINRDRIKSYVSSTLKVHPESTDKFLESFLASAIEAKLCSITGDEITFTDGKSIQFNSENEVDNNEENEEIEQTDFHENEKSKGNDSKESLNKDNKDLGIPQQRIKNSAPTIELKIDPTLDPDKLEKQLEVLRKFGLV